MPPRGLAYSLGDSPGPAAPWVRVPPPVSLCAGDSFWKTSIRLAAWQASLFVSSDGGLPTPPPTLFIYFPATISTGIDKGEELKARAYIIIIKMQI